MAQLVARFHGMEEVRGSIPLSSTNVMSRDIRLQICVPAFYFFCLNQWLSLLDFLGPEFCYSWLLRVAPLGVAGHDSVVVSGCTRAGRTDASEHGSCQSLLA